MCKARDPAQCVVLPHDPFQNREACKECVHVREVKFKELKPENCAQCTTTNFCPREEPESSGPIDNSSIRHNHSATD